LACLAAADPGGLAPGPAHLTFARIWGKVRRFSTRQGAFFALPILFWSTSDRSSVRQRSRPWSGPPPHLRHH